MTCGTPQVISFFGILSFLQHKYFYRYAHERMYSMDKTNNYIKLCGEMVSKPEYSHSGKFEKFYTFPLSVLRLSGAADRINIILREELLQKEIGDGDHICVEGEIHSFNNKSGVGNKLVISVLARDIYVTDEGDLNQVELYGTLCKKPNFRVTPMGREICDMMLAVNRKYGKSDYLPCIAWGRLAKIASQWDVGKEIHISGRLQSRCYIKTEGDQQIEKTAFEISAAFIEET